MKKIARKIGSVILFFVFFVSVGFVGKLEAVIASGQKEYSSYAKYDSRKTLLYSWKFEKNLLKGDFPKEQELKITFGASLDKMIRKYTGGYQAFFFQANFRNHFSIPAEVKVKIDTDWRKKQDGGKLYLYSYSKGDHEISLLKAPVMEKEGYLIFTLMEERNFIVTDQMLSLPEINGEMEKEAVWRTVVGLLVLFLLAGICIYWIVNSERREKNGEK